jgi:hypothetical protein
MADQPAPSQAHGLLPKMVLRELIPSIVGYLDGSSLFNTAIA